MSRTEQWTKDGHTAHVEVTDDETVIVAYRILANMMSRLGYTQAAYGPSGTAGRADGSGPR